MFKIPPILNPPHPGRPALFPQQISWGRPPSSLLLGPIVIVFFLFHPQLLLPPPLLQRYQSETNGRIVVCGMWRICWSCSTDRMHSLGWLIPFRCAHTHTQRPESTNRFPTEKKKTKKSLCDRASLSYKKNSPHLNKLVPSFYYYHASSSTSVLLVITTDVLPPLRFLDGWLRPLCKTPSPKSSPPPQLLFLLLLLLQCLF